MESPGPLRYTEVAETAEDNRKEGAHVAPSSAQGKHTRIPGDLMREMMMVRYLVWPLLVGTALLSNACMVTTEQFQALQQDVRTRRGDVNAMGKRAGGDGGSRSTDLVARLEELAVETRMVQGQLEEANYRMSELSKRLDATEVKVARPSGGGGGARGGTWGQGRGWPGAGGKGQIRGVGTPERDGMGRRGKWPASRGRRGDPA